MPAAKAKKQVPATKAPTAPTEFNLTGLLPEEVNTIIIGLTNGTYNTVAPLIAKIQEQLIAQGAALKTE